MDVTSLKKYIYENNKIEFILKEIGCHDIQYHINKEFYSCANYNGDNKSAINVKNNEYLNVKNWTRSGFDDGSDIITLVEYNKQLSFINAVKYLHNILGLEYKYDKKSNKKEKKVNPLEIFEKHLNRRTVNVDDIHILNEDLLNDYVPLLYIDWYKEGIMPWTAKKFGLMFSYKWKRVIIPTRHWLTGQLVATNARTVVENYDLFDIKKYFITSGYNKSLNLYGYWENHEEINKAKYCVIYEAEKSVLKRDSRNDTTGLALQGKSISSEQVRIILSLDIKEVVIALDKDVPIEEVWDICEKFYNIRKVSYIWDSWGLLGDKDSPADAPNKIFEFLLKYRIVFDAKKHREYLKSLEKR